MLHHFHNLHPIGSHRDATMASPLHSSTIPFLKPSNLSYFRRRKAPFPANRVFRCDSRKPSSSSVDGGSKSENAMLRAAWYGSELLGIAASFFRPTPPQQELPDVADDGLGITDRARAAEAIKDDFRRSYFVTGNLTLNAYNEDCEFADPAGSFRGLRRFKRNCSNFGSLLEKSNMKLMKWEECEDKAIGHWRFSCVMLFPWRPILSATGYTEYYFDIHSGKVCRHVEHWNVPKMTLLKQIFKPSRWIWDTNSKTQPY